MRTATKWFLFLTPISLALFLPLFFELNYPEVIKNGWPLTRCHILESQVLTRYCCESQCNGGCSSAPSGAPQCSVLISMIDTTFSPSACASNSSACPTAIGSTCDGGYYCCSNCCSTCSSCTTTCATSCSGNPQVCSSNCAPSCTSHSCNCTCCSSTSHRACTIDCPSCFSVQLNIAYYTSKLAFEQTTYTQDFSKDSTGADNFLEAHPSNSTSKCFYNPKDLSQVTFGVSFTAWKWAITAIFGMLPLLACIGYFVYLGGGKIWDQIAGFFKWIAGLWKSKDSGTSTTTSAFEKEPVAGPSNFGNEADEAPPPYKG